MHLATLFHPGMQIVIVAASWLALPSRYPGGCCPILVTLPLCFILPSHLSAKQIVTHQGYPPTYLRTHAKGTPLLCVGRNVPRMPLCSCVGSLPVRASRWVPAHPTPLLSPFHPCRYSFGLTRMNKPATIITRATANKPDFTRIPGSAASNGPKIALVTDETAP